MQRLTLKGTVGSGAGFPNSHPPLCWDEVWKHLEGRRGQLWSSHCLRVKSTVQTSIRFFSPNPNAFP